jgi:hypothetical protein
MFQLCHVNGLKASMAHISELTLSWSMQGHIPFRWLLQHKHFIYSVGCFWLRDPSEHMHKWLDGIIRWGLLGRKGMTRPCSTLLPIFSISTMHNCGYFLQLPAGKQPPLPTPPECLPISPAWFECAYLAPIKPSRLKVAHVVGLVLSTYSTGNL